MVLWKVKNSLKIIVTLPRYYYLGKTNVEQVGSVVIILLCWVVVQSTSVVSSHPLDGLPLPLRWVFRKYFAYALLVFFEVHAVHEGVCVTMLILVIQALLHILGEVMSTSMAHNVLRKCDTKYHVSKDFITLMHARVLHEQVNNKIFNEALKKKMRRGGDITCCLETLVREFCLFVYGRCIRPSTTIVQDPINPQRHMVMVWKRNVVEAR